MQQHHRSNAVRKLEVVQVEEQEKIHWDSAEQGEAIRPFRLWDADKKHNMPHRCFTHKKNAHMAALCEARWLYVGASIEVYDCRTMKLLGQYTRREHTIHFMEG